MRSMRNIFNQCVAVVFTTVCTVLAAPELGAQLSPDVNAAVGRARAHLNTGDGVAARAILDSLVNNAPRASDDLAESLYWRAVMSEQVADAEQDWKMLIVTSPLSPRTPDALLRLGELEILRGRPAGARAYYDRLLRDFADSPQRPKAMLWMARSYFEERDLAHACETVAVLRRGDPLEGELKLQSNEMQGRCDNAAERTAAVAAAANPATTKAAAGGGVGANGAASNTAGESTRGKYTVQLAATETRAAADAMVKRFASRGVKARVDGTRKPYRIRVGRFETRAAATDALTKLKKQGHKGFVAEVDK